MPVAVTVNVAVPPSATVAFCGCPVMVGAGVAAAGEIVSRKVLDVAGRCWTLRR